MTPAAWKTVAALTVSNSRSTAAGSRTSPTTVSTVGAMFSRRGASSASWTRHRTRARGPARARTRFWPSQPAAPVTTTIGDGARSGPALVAFRALTGLLLSRNGPGPRLQRHERRRYASRLTPAMGASATFSAPRRPRGHDVADDEPRGARGVPRRCPRRRYQRRERRPGTVERPDLVHVRAVSYTHLRAHET